MISKMFTPSPNYDDRPEGVQIRYIILHYTALENTPTSLNWMCDREKKVSAHYLICRTGQVYQLVDDDKRAWHAGVSSWGSDTNLNHTSLGIELDNNGSEAFSEPQIDVLLELLNDLCEKHSIPKENVLGHQDIAPDRKIDPGPYFPWEKLYDQGFSLSRRSSTKNKI